MAQQPMAQQPMAQQPMAQQPMPPPQMMNVGGELMPVVDDADDVALLLEELGLAKNRIPDSSALFERTGDPILDAHMGRGSISNAIMEDARKFNPEQTSDMTLEERAILQSADTNLPKVLGYAGGGIVELQEGGAPEDDPNWLERGWEYSKANPLDVISTAAMAIPGIGLGGSALLKGGLWGLKALKASQRGAKLWNRLKGVRPHSLYSRPNPKASSASRGFGHDEVLGGRAIADPRVFSPQRLGGTMFGAGLLGKQFTGDDDEAQAADVRDFSDVGGGGGPFTQDTGADQVDQGPEPGSLEWIKQQQLQLYRSGGEDREAKLQEILSRQREQGTLRQEQDRSDMVTSALMGLAVGVGSGDPSEGFRLAGSAVERIRSAARSGAIAQQNAMDQLELEGMDSREAEKVAALVSMADIERLQQQRMQLDNTAVNNAFKVIQAQAQSLSQQSLASGTGVITQVDLFGRIARAYQLALADPNNQNAYMAALLQPAGGSNDEFTDPATGQAY